MNIKILAITFISAFFLITGLGCSDVEFSAKPSNVSGKGDAGDGDNGDSGDDGGSSSGGDSGSSSGGDSGSSSGGDSGSSSGGDSGSSSGGDSGSSSGDDCIICGDSGSSSGGDSGSSSGSDSGSSSGDDGGDGGDPCQGSDNSIPPEIICPPNTAYGVFDFETAVNGSNVWAVTNRSGSGKLTVYNIGLNKDKNNVYPMKTWHLNNSDQNRYGNRTYVTEVGLLIGKINGKVYLVDKNTPEGHIDALIWNNTQTDDYARHCVTSYSINDVSYIGVAWSNLLGRKFTQIPIDVSKPGKVDIAARQTFSLGGGLPSEESRWSYSCFVDQENKRFWGAGLRSPNVYGIDLLTKSPLTGAQAPNANHTNLGLGKHFRSPEGTKPGSNYAFAGDALGNPLRGEGGYTYVHEVRNNIIYRTHGTQIIAAPAECYSTNTDCRGKVYAFNMSSIGQIGPLSSLNDGRFVGIARGDSSSQVYTLWPKDKNDLSKGLEAERIKQISGDAYMYNDFTGGSLYSKDIEMTVNLDDLTVFIPGKRVTKVIFTWTSAAGGHNEWKGLKLEARCYTSGGNKPNYVEVTPVNDAGMATVIAAPSCVFKFVNRLDLRVTNPTGTQDFVRTRQIKIIVEQE